MLWFEHDLFGKPVTTQHQVRGRPFPDHARAPARAETTSQDCWGPPEAIYAGRGMKRSGHDHRQNGEADGGESHTKGEGRQIALPPLRSSSENLTSGRSLQ